MSDLRQNVSPKVYIFVLGLDFGALLKERLELLVRELIATFELPIVIAFLLDSIISQVHKLVFDVACGELFGAGTEVAVFVEVALELAVDGGEEPIHPDVEFPLIDE